MSGIQDSNLVLSTPTFFLSTWWPSIRWPWPMFNESFLQKARTQYGSKKWYSNCGNKGWGDKNQHWWVAWLGWRKRLVSSTHFPCPFKGLFLLFSLSFLYVPPLIHGILKSCIPPVYQDMSYIEKLVRATPAGVVRASLVGCSAPALGIFESHNQ